MATRRENNIDWNARDRASGLRLPKFPRPSFRRGWMAFAAALSADAAIFVVVASAITLAVLTQDPGARAAPPRAAGLASSWPMPPVVSQRQPRTPGTGPASRASRSRVGVGPHFAPPDSIPEQRRRGKQVRRRHS